MNSVSRVAAGVPTLRGPGVESAALFDEGINGTVGGLTRVKQKAALVVVRYGEQPFDHRQMAERGKFVEHEQTRRPPPSSTRARLNTCNALGGVYENIGIKLH